MSQVIACLDLDLPEFTNWIVSNARVGFEPRFLSTDSAELEHMLRDADFIVAAEADITAAMIAHAPSLRLIQLTQTGYDNVDVDAANKAGIPVCNAPGVNAASVAEHTLMLILATLRRLPECDRRVRNSEWPQLDMFRKGIHDFGGATLGIVGLGAVGTALVPLCRPLAGDVIYFKRHRLPVQEEEGLGVSYAPLEELLRRSDIVTLHVSLNEETRGMIGLEQLSLMKPTAILINTARGGVVDQDAFVEHMRAGGLRGAAFDVLWEEPLPPHSRLLSLDNMVFTPHIAAASQEVTWRIFEMSFDNVYRVAAGKQPLNRVSIGT